MSEYDRGFYKFIADCIRIQLDRYRDVHIEFHKRDKYYYILIGFRYIEEGWINYINRLKLLRQIGNTHSYYLVR